MQSILITEPFLFKKVSDKLNRIAVNTPMVCDVCLPTHTGQRK